MGTNKVVCMDNLEFMRTLSSESIDLIYGDILYGTGKKFKDYQDLKADKKVIEDFYIPRIEEMHRLLNTNGSIYLQMDNKINHWIRYILDDIFGYNNFRNEIIYCRLKGSKPCKNLPLNHDVILRYSKSNQYTYNQLYIQAKDNSISRYNKTDENGKKYKIYHKDGKEWYRSYYKGKSLNDVWDDLHPLNSKNSEWMGYDTQKPKSLLDRIISIASNKGDIIGDFFCGTGTTGVSAKGLNRKYCLCDINPRAIEITNSRLAN
jgi:site-specific DNA-methyltransferase (adenine-specific)